MQQTEHKPITASDAVRIATRFSTIFPWARQSTGAVSEVCIAADRGRTCIKATVISVYVWFRRFPTGTSGLRRVIVDRFTGEVRRVDKI